MPRHPKIVESARYHIWTDALHARELAKQAKNKWDRGTYIRWAVTSAWTTLEMVCEETLGANGIGRRFKENLDEAIVKNGLLSLDWGSGVWQRIAAIHKARKEFVHVNSCEDSLFPPVSMADNAVNDIRAAIQDLFGKMGNPTPSWVLDDQDRGWDKGKGSIMYSLTIQPGADPASSNVVRIGFVYKDVEHICYLFPDGTNPEQGINQLIQNTSIPISRVRAYVGTKLVIDSEIPMRGA